MGPVFSWFSLCLRSRGRPMVLFTMAAAAGIGTCGGSIGGPSLSRRWRTWPYWPWPGWWPLDAWLPMMLLTLYCFIVARVTRCQMASSHHFVSLSCLIIPDTATHNSHQSAFGHKCFLRGLKLSVSENNNINSYHLNNTKNYVDIWDVNSQYFRSGLYQYRFNMILKFKFYFTFTTSVYM